MLNFYRTGLKFCVKISNIYKRYNLNFKFIEIIQIKDSFQGRLNRYKRVYFFNGLIFGTVSLKTRNKFGQRILNLYKKQILFW